MIKRCLILPMLVMLLMPLAGVSAQADREGFDYCQMAPAPDCQILINSEAAMAEVSSFAFDIDVSLDLAADGEGNNSRMRMTGNGRIAADPEAIAALNDMEGLDSVDVDAMRAGLGSLLTSIEGEVSLLVTEITTDKTGAEVVSETPVNLIMENGVYALDLASMVEASGESIEGMEGFEWLGVDLNGAAASILAEATASFNTESGMMNMDESGLAESMTITRLPDGEVNGTAVAVFELSIDYATLLEVIDITAVMAGMSADAAADQFEVEAMLESFQDAALVIREHIGLEDFYAYRVDIAAESAFASFALRIDLGDFNAPVDVDIPDDAFILPYALMTQMQMQMRASS